MEERIGISRRLVVTLVVALGMGLVVGLVATLLEFASASVVAVTPLILVHGILALAAGALLAAFFGRGGALGWILALAVGALITAIASFLAPMLSSARDVASARAALETVPGTLSSVTLEAFALPSALVASPFLGLLWIALVSAVHAAAGGARQV